MEEHTSTSDFVDLELERQMLRYLLLEDAVLLPAIDPNIFFGDGEQIIIEVLKKIQTTFPASTAAQMVLKHVSGNDYDTVDAVLDKVLDADQITNMKAAEEVLGSLRDLYLQRTVIEDAETAIDYALEGDVKGAMEVLRSVVSTSASQNIATGDYLEDYEERVKIIEGEADQTKHDKSALIPTGIRDLDKETGGFKKGETWVIISRTGGGKSMAKLYMGAFAWLKNYNVIHVGLEMDKFESEFRADSLLTKIPGSMFRFANLDEETYKRWQNQMKHLRQDRKNYFEFISGSSLSITDIINLVEGVENKRNARVDMVIVDYTQIIKPEINTRDNHLAQADTFIKLVNWAKSRKLLALTSAQPTDEGVSRKDGFKVTDIKYARAISHYASGIISFHQNGIDEKEHSAHLKIIKGRGTKEGADIIVKPQPETMILHSIDYLTMMAPMLWSAEPMKKSPGKRK